MGKKKKKNRMKISNLPDKEFKVIVINSTKDAF